jgi:hypothetical protein
MCQPKYWNKIYTKEIGINKEGSILTIFAERSDLEIIELELVLTRVESIPSLTDKLKRAIDSLESYRDCDCTARLGTCIKHLNSISMQEITNSGGPKSVVTFGRR